MSKFSVDYNVLDNSVNRKSFRLAEVQDRIVKVAFDIVKFKDNDTEQLWQVQSNEDGDYIVSLYSEPEESLTVQASDKTLARNWRVTLDKVANELTFFYRNTRIAKVASSTLNVPVEEIDFVVSYLPKRLASNKTLVSKLLNDLDTVSRSEVLQNFPELA